jgi:hypothetical protein
MCTIIILTLRDMGKYPKITEYWLRVTDLAASGTNFFLKCIYFWGYTNDKVKMRKNILFVVMLWWKTFQIKPQNSCF